MCMFAAMLAAVDVKFGTFAGVDFRSANITRGSIVNPEPIQCFTGGMNMTLGTPDDPLGANALGGRVWTCNHLTAKRDHQMERYFNETDPFLYLRNRYLFAEGWASMTEAGPCWVLYRPFKGEAETPFPEVEWRVRQELDTPWITPYFYLRHTFKPYSLTYWQTGLKRTLDVADKVSVMPFTFLDWGDDNLFAFKYGESRGHLDGGVSSLDVGVRGDWRINGFFSAWLQVEGYWLVNAKARAANRDRASVTSRNEIAVVSFGVTFDF